MKRREGQWRGEKGSEEERRAVKMRERSSEEERTGSEEERTEQ